MIVEASRNGSPTTTLEDGFFDLLSDTTLSTNIFGQEDVFPVVITEKSWVQSSPEAIQYDLDVLHDDTLAISCNIRGLSFEFLVARDTTSLE